MTQEHVASALGRLTGVIEGMSKQMTRLEIEAKEHRGRVAGDLREIRDAQQGLATADMLRDARADSHEARLVDVEKTAEVINSRTAKTTGALMVLGVIGALLWGAVRFFKEAILTTLGT